MRSRPEQVFMDAIPVIANRRQPLSTKIAAEFIIHNPTIEHAIEQIAGYLGTVPVCLPDQVDSLRQVRNEFQDSRYMKGRFTPKDHDRSRSICHRSGSRYRHLLGAKSFPACSIPTGNPCDTEQATHITTTKCDRKYRAETRFVRHFGLG
ncbi:hypothetical protein SDC9_173822 [bioreactor metagenome]|uniref:Uncharacterized protein n=1 Tax=bioreactor metagenome TaxID=1076179 RepID=A0A645GHJ1_9ZZZZ